MRFFFHHSGENWQVLRRKHLSDFGAWIPFADLERGRAAAGLAALRTQYPAIRWVGCKECGFWDNSKHWPSISSLASCWIPDILSPIPSCEDYLPQHRRRGWHSSRESQTWNSKVHFRSGLQCFISSAFTKLCKKKLLCIMPLHADASKRYLKSQYERDFTAFRAGTVFLQMFVGFVSLPLPCVLACGLSSACLWNALQELCQ